MRIEKVEDVLTAIEEARVAKGISESELSKSIGKSAGLYWWLKRRGKTLSLATVLEYTNALGLKITIK